MLNSEGNEFQAENSLAFFFFSLHFHLPTLRKEWSVSANSSRKADTKPAHSDFAFRQSKTLEEEFDHSLKFHEVQQPMLLRFLNNSLKGLV